MKFYSDITKKLYESESDLNQDEKNHQVEIENKKTEAVNERKEAAKLVEKAFESVAAYRKEANAKRDALEEKSKELNKKYDAKIHEIEVAREKDFEGIEEELRNLDKDERQKVEEAYTELRKFCKQYGAYHYSVDAGGADLFPMLMGFGQLERAQNIFSDMLNLFF